MGHDHIRWILRYGLFTVLLLICTAGGAQTVYKCTGRNGAVSYQDAPCSTRGSQQVLHLHDAQPRHSETPAPTTSVTPVAPKAERYEPAPRPLPPPPAALPQLYTCVRATDGKHYVSRNGNPPAYFVPLSVVGAGYRSSLSDAYGGKNAARDAASDPQLARGRITHSLNSGNYTLVQDSCRPMNRDNLCDHIDRQLDKIEHKLRNAFRSDQPPLERRAKTLRAQQVACSH